jgi:hypothetical protein
VKRCRRSRRTTDKGLYGIERTTGTYFAGGPVVAQPQPGTTVVQPSGNTNNTGANNTGANNTGASPGVNNTGQPTAPPRNLPDSDGVKIALDWLENHDDQWQDKAAELRTLISRVDAGTATTEELDKYEKLATQAITDYSNRPKLSTPNNTGPDVFLT